MKSYYSQNCIKYLRKWEKSIYVILETHCSTHEKVQHEGENAIVTLRVGWKKDAEVAFHIKPIVLYMEMSQ